MEFGRVQARNMLQHLWTGPISNAAVDVVQGLKSVEVRPIGVSKVRFLPDLDSSVPSSMILTMSPFPQVAEIQSA